MHEETVDVVDPETGEVTQEKTNLVPGLTEAGELLAAAAAGLKRPKGPSRKERRKRQTLARLGKRNAARREKRLQIKKDRKEKREAKIMEKLIESSYEAVITEEQ